MASKEICEEDERYEGECHYVLLLWLLYIILYIILYTSPCLLNLI